MKNLKWVKDNNKYLLKKDQTTLLDLYISLANGSFFNIDDKQYLLKRKCFWKSAYLVTLNDEEILTLSDSFWGNKGKILFNDGKLYSVRFKTRGGLKMCFMDGDDEIVSYTATVENKKNIMEFSTGNSKIDTTKLLVLSAVGMAIFTSSYIETTSGTDDSLLIMIAAGS